MGFDRDFLGLLHNPRQRVKVSLFQRGLNSSNILRETIQKSNKLPDPHLVFRFLLPGRPAIALTRQIFESESERMAHLAPVSTSENKNSFPEDRRLNSQQMASQNATSKVQTSEA